MELEPGENQESIYSGVTGLCLIRVFTLQEEVSGYSLRNVKYYGDG